MPHLKVGQLLRFVAERRQQLTWTPLECLRRRGVHFALARTLSYPHTLAARWRLLLAATLKEAGLEGELEVALQALRRSLRDLPRDPGLAEIRLWVSLGESADDILALYAGQLQSHAVDALFRTLLHNRRTRTATTLAVSMMHQGWLSRICRLLVSRGRQEEAEAASHRLWRPLERALFLAHRAVKHPRADRVSSALAEIRRISNPRQRVRLLTHLAAGIKASCPEMSANAAIQAVAEASESIGASELDRLVRVLMRFRKTDTGREAMRTLESRHPMLRARVLRHRLASRRRWSGRTYRVTVRLLMAAGLEAVEEAAALCLLAHGRGRKREAREVHAVIRMKWLDSREGASSCLRRAARRVHGCMPRVAARWSRWANTSGLAEDLLAQLLLASDPWLRLRLVAGGRARRGDAALASRLARSATRGCRRDAMVQDVQALSRRRRFREARAVAAALDCRQAWAEARELEAGAERDIGKVTEMTEEALTARSPALPVNIEAIRVLASICRESGAAGPGTALSAYARPFLAGRSLRVSPAPSAAGDVVVDETATALELCIATASREAALTHHVARVLLRWIRGAEQAWRRTVLAQ